MLDLIFYLLIIGAGTGGELCVTRAMKAVGEVKDFRPAALLDFTSRACEFLDVGWPRSHGDRILLPAGIAVAENVSLVVPVTALSYGAGALGGKFFLGEQVTPKRWAGVLLVCMGVALVIMGRR